MTHHDPARRITFFSVPVDLLDMQETVARAEEAMESGKSTRHTALNVAKLVALRSNEELAEDVCGSDIVGIDGQGIVLGLRLFGVEKAERVAGCDLMVELLALCARTGRKPYILGARQDMLERAVANAKRDHPGLEFAGYRNGYFSPDDEPGIVADIAASGADCLFVAMPTPHKERFLKRNSDQLQVPFVMGVGGSVDWLAGHVTRAPGWMQRFGLEWLHRLLKEPRKMFKRYATTNIAFAGLLAGALLSNRKPVA